MDLEQLKQFVEPVKPYVDTISIGTIIGYFFGLLPHIATLFTAIWAILRVYESKTVQNWLKNRKARRR